MFNVSQKLKSEKTSITPMPFTLFYWMKINEDDHNFYISHSNIFRPDKNKYVDTLIRSNIQKTLTKNQEQQQAPSDAVVENPQQSKEDERRERKLRKERKERRDKAQ